MSQAERWHLGGNAPEIYQHYLVPAIFGPWAPLLTEQAKLRAGERVLDIGCGTGVVARRGGEQVGLQGKSLVWILILVCSKSLALFHRLKGLP
jgi:2-polyprenyl-3-methyl-5-hydroxy-6-metoxy-1,4-benzoquinol methylase